MPLPAIKPHPPKYTHEHIIKDSPLWKRDYIRTHVGTSIKLPQVPQSPRKLKEREDSFILDCILMEKRRYKWSKDIIPKYDALEDEHADHYFKSPLVQHILRKTIGSEISKPKEDHVNLNKLSTRRRVKRSPSPETLKKMREKYVNNSVAATNEVTKYNLLNPAYNALGDPHATEYFQRKGVPRVLAVTLSQQGLRPKSHPMTKMDKGGCSIDGPVIDRFIESGAGYRYLHARNGAPGAAKSGHSTDQVNGHSQFMSEAKPNFGYHGDFGYRRNTPWLRQMPSQFGTDGRSPLH